ncbi:lactosylceramide 1,3-N-acetyl-beta-D-glucosaminyltransferase A-like [Littorina saxatilis]|uniref:Hexosyltransferase n=1 Tax=Littorina saxatilis TaxID=31220 RepID=A0AAN9GJ88_9CAEN
MARMLRKSCLFTRSCRTAVKRCVAVVAVVCVIKLVTLLPIYLVTKHRLFNSFFGKDSVNSFTITTGDSVGNWKDITDFDWRPNLSKVQQLLAYLNMTADEARESLPLTLESRLLLSNDSVCGPADDDPVDLLFLVHTAPLNFQRRLQMRGSVMGQEHFRPFKVRVVFLLGEVGNSSLQAALDYEHVLYRDTVQGDFQDSYRNLSHKGVMGFRWVTRHCPQARYVVKLDDDVFFDTYKMLLRYRGIFEGQKRTIFCNVWVRDSMPVYREDKWAVEERLFQGLDRFPFDYCSGLAVVITGDLVPALYRAAFFTPVFWIDDIYLFGMLPWVAGDVTMMDLGYRSQYVAMNTTYALSCMKELQSECSVLATNCYTTDDWENMWNLTNNLHVAKGWRVPYLRVN